MTKTNEVNQIVVRDKEGAKYTLKFSRRVVEQMERNGFKVDMDKPNTMIRDLFRGAFRTDPFSRRVADDPVRLDEIWKFQRKKEDLLTALIRMYMKTLDDLMAEPEDEDDENPTWETM